MMPRAANAKKLQEENHRLRAELDQAQQSLAVLQRHGNEASRVAEARADSAIGRTEEVLREKQHLEAVLRQMHESEERFRTLADNIAQFAWMADRDGQVFWYNRRWYEYTGTTFSEVSGWGWQKVHHPEHLNRAVEKFRQHLESGQIWEDTFPIRSKDGDYHWFLSRAIPIRDAEGHIWRWFGTNTDITARQRIEESLRRTVERVGLLSEVASELLVAEQPEAVIESLGHKLMALLECHLFFNFMVDDTAQRLHLNVYAGISPEEAQSIEWLDFESSVCGCVVRDGRRIVVDNLAASCDPRIAHVRRFGLKTYACHPLMNQGRALGILSFGSRTKLAFTEDELSLMKVVSDHVALAIQRVRLRELAERRAAEAQAANEAKTRFLANISHELRTPMNAILGMVELAMQNAVSAKTLDCLSTARESADLLLSLLNDLLDSAKIESGHLELDESPFNLRVAIESVTRVLAARAAEKGLTFACHVAEDVPPALVGDKTRLRQILFNILGNAIKFTEQGEVRMDVKRAESEPPFPNPQSLIPSPASLTLHFTVCDTGIGISEDEQQRIFRPFVQGDTSTARRFGGTGLGLSISASLVALMNGRIWVESESGVGSRFHFTVRLPQAESLPIEERPTVPVPTAPTRKLRVLLVEDNPANQKLARYLLGERQHTVDVASSGPQAIRMFESRRYDAVLMDIQMPGMDGLETADEIRKQQDGAGRVPIVAITAHAMKDDRQRCLAHGMDAFLSKPIDGQEMIALVENLTSGTPPRDAEEDPLPAAPVFDRALALRRCGGNRALLAEMTEVFLEESNILLPAMCRALERGDFRELGSLGHRLKGTIVYLGARPASDAADRVEQFALGHGKPAEANEAIKALSRQCELLRQQVTSDAEQPK